METSDLVNGNKMVLIGEFRRMYPYHGRKWRSILKKHNPWHATDTGLRAWQNLSSGTTGNESLRLILQDMTTIIDQDSKTNAVKRQKLS